MPLHHIALWVQDLERMKDFYCDYLGGTANQRYHNPKTGFFSYFLDFGQGARLELMQGLPAAGGPGEPGAQRLGLTHLSFSTGSREAVDALTARLVRDGYALASAARTTGDGYYESVVLDPEGNRIELTV